MYIVPNWFNWNFLFEGDVVGYYFLMIFIPFYFFWMFEIINNKKIKLIHNIIFSIIGIGIMHFTYDSSIKIGNNQVNSKLFMIKEKIDKYKSINNIYPNSIKDLKLNLFQKTLPIFIILSGKMTYHLKAENLNEYVISISTLDSGGDIALSITENGNIQKSDI